MDKIQHIFGFLLLLFSTAILSLFRKRRKYKIYLSLAEQTVKLLFSIEVRFIALFMDLMSASNEINVEGIIFQYFCLEEIGEIAIA